MRAIASAGVNRLCVYRLNVSLVNVPDALKPKMFSALLAGDDDSEATAETVVQRASQDALQLDQCRTNLFLVLILN